MKKISIVAVLAIAAAGFTACGNQGPKANLKTDVDTMSYAIGMAQTQGLKEYLVGSLDVDTAYMAEFIKGLNEGANAGDNKKKAAYYAGIQIGQQIANRMVKGINHEVFGDDQEVAQRLIQSIKAKELVKTYGPNKEAGEKFLASNAKKDGVKTLPSGVQYKVIKEGTGAIPADTSLVKVNYEGRLINDTIFDSSYKRGEPAMFRANQVIKGWTEALTHMPAGSVWEVYIPQELAYGERAQSKIDPFSALIFKIELIEVNPKRK